MLLIYILYYSYITLILLLFNTLVNYLFTVFLFIMGRF